MRAIIRDYSRPGDLIVDPCAGGATTLIAAAIEGRRSIGSEMDETTFKKAQARIKAGYTPLLDFDKFTPRPAAEEKPECTKP
jgi:site-specific DNA-methyltransferase (adenine-specific)